jgi:hypothetical protein
MKKEWVKNTDSQYSLSVEEKKMGDMNFHLNSLSSKAVCTLGEQVLKIKRTGFWKSSIEITDSQNAVLLKTYPEKWYANTSIIEYDNKKYKLIVRNNPLAEYAITENGEEWLAYGLATTDKKISVKISAHEHAPLIFDFLLWYLFLPVANENMGDNYSFLLLTS